MSTWENRAPGGRDSSLSTPPAIAGRVLGGRWTIVRPLGTGGTASVYEAVHRNGRRVAVKLLHPVLASIPAVKQRFQSEGYAANRVPHPNVVAILDDGEEPDGTVFLVMELLEGRSLAACLSEQVLPVDTVTSAAMAVLDVLAAAHDSGVVHRDVKPANVFMTHDGRIKLLDFGAARVWESATDSTVTESGFTVGTPAFMAPEQAAGRTAEIDALTDVWAVGATMFQLLARRLVHQTTSAHGAIVAAATVPAPLLRSVAAHVCPEVADVVDRALAFDRSERWPNARSMRQALAHACPTAVREVEPQDISSETESLAASHSPGSTAPAASAQRPHESRRVPSARVAIFVLCGAAPFGLFAAFKTHEVPSRAIQIVSTARPSPSKTNVERNPSSVVAPQAPRVAAITAERSSTIEPHAASPAASTTRQGARASRRPGLLLTPLESEDLLLDRRK